MAETQSGAVDRDAPMLMSCTLLGREEKIMRIFEVEKNGSLTLPPEVLGHAEPHTCYVLETRGTKLTLRPQPSNIHRPRARDNRRRSPDTWEKERCALTEELSRIWPEGVSVVDVLSEMRR